MSKTLQVPSRFKPYPLRHTRDCLNKVVSFFVPSVTTLGMKSRVTGFAQCDEVIFIVCSTFGQRNLVVYLLSRDQQSVILAQLTQRMSRSISVTDTFPCTSVSSSDSGITVVFFVAFCFFLGVFLAEPSVSQLGTTGMGAGTLGFYGH